MAMGSSSRTPPGSCGIAFRPPAPVKGGCSTCKARRVKCDETRPSCRRCTAAGKVCDARVNCSESCSPGPRPPLPSPPTPSVSLARCNTHAGLAGLSPSNKRHFEWFVREASGRLPGMFRSPYWKRLVLQASSTEPAVLYAILALGAAHEKESSTAEPCRRAKPDEGGEPESPGTAGRLCLQLYNKSISLLQPHFSKRSAESTRVALVVCTVFFCLEFMQERYKTGFLHFGYSLQLLGNLLRSRASAASAADPVDDWFAEEIPRIDLQAALFTNEFYLGAANDTSLLWDSLPRVFRTTRDASHSLDGLLFRALKLQKNGCAINLSGDAVDIFELLATQQTLRRDLEGWLQSFNVFKANSWGDLSDAERLACRRLPIYHTMAHIVTNTSLNPRNELIFDLYTHQFASVVSHAREILDDAAQPSDLPTPAADTPGPGPLHDPQPERAVDAGLIPPLFFTAVKCRVPRIRRQAAELIMLAHRHEGIWDAVLSARVAREVMALEERGVQDGPQAAGKRDSADSRASTPQCPPRVHKLWIEASGDRKGDIHLSFQRISNGQVQEALTRRYDAADGSWTSCPVAPRVSEATNREGGNGPPQTTLA
ncbi:hypothetical protein LX36DRAFT_621227 [Colletotrichum falcatum]|nr:hypothetical protein LX36DRAFT_621227 [Colletotrichum falcatum]